MVQARRKHDEETRAVIFAPRAAPLAKPSARPGMSFSQSFQRRDAAAQLTSEAVERPEWLVNTKPSPHFDVLCRLFESLRDKPQKRRDQIVSMIQASFFVYCQTA